MIRTSLRFLLVFSVLALALPAAAAQTVVNFDDNLPASMMNYGGWYDLTGTSYAGLVWEPNHGGGDVDWSVLDTDPNLNAGNRGWAMPYSGANVAFNGGGRDADSFSFPSRTFPSGVTFQGAWFAQDLKDTPATSVWFTDDRGDTSRVMDLLPGNGPTTDPQQGWQFLGVDWAGVSTVTVHRSGGSYFAMDNLTYSSGSPAGGPTPELPPAALMLLSTVPLGLVWAKRRRRT